MYRCWISCEHNTYMYWQSYTVISNLLFSLQLFNLQRNKSLMKTWQYQQSYNWGICIQAFSLSKWHFSVKACVDFRRLDIFNRFKRCPRLCNAINVMVHLLCKKFQCNLPAINKYVQLLKCFDIKWKDDRRESVSCHAYYRQDKVRYWNLAWLALDIIFHYKKLHCSERVSSCISFRDMYAHVELVTISQRIYCPPKRPNYLWT